MERHSSREGETAQDEGRAQRKTPPTFGFGAEDRRGRNREEAKSSGGEINPPDLPCQSRFCNFFTMLLRARARPSRRTALRRSPGVAPPPRTSRVRDWRSWEWYTHTAMFA